MSSAQYTTVRFDLLYNDQPPERGSNFMDLTHASGFAYLDWNIAMFTVDPSHKRLHT